MYSLQVLVKNECGVNFISSKLVADIFGREHKSILRQIDNLELSRKLDGAQSALSSYRNEQNKSQPMRLLDQVSFFVLINSLNLKDPSLLDLRDKISKDLRGRLSKRPPKIIATTCRIPIDNPNSEYPSLKKVLLTEADPLDKELGYIMQAQNQQFGWSKAETKHIKKAEEIMMERGVMYLNPWPGLSLGQGGLRLLLSK